MVLVPTADCVYQLLVGGESAKRIGRQFEAAVGEIYSPSNMLVDVLEMLLEHRQQRQLELDEFMSRVTDLANMPVEIVPLPSISTDIARLVGKGIPLRDSMYIASARAIDADILTVDSTFWGRLRANYENVVLV